MRKVYLLLPRRRKSGPWVPWYDKAFGFVVRANDEATARNLASKNHGDEGPEPWLDKLATSCEVLTGEGPEVVVLRDFASA